MSIEAVGVETQSVLAAYRRQDRSPAADVIIVLSLMVIALDAPAARHATPVSPAPAATTPLTPPAGSTADNIHPSEGATVPGSPRRIDISDDLYVRQLDDGVLVITHSFPWAGNSLIVEMENSDLVLVDTPYTPEATRDLLAWTEARYGRRPVAAINTGYHYDNLGGNSYLIEQGIPVYGSRLTAQLLAERGDTMRAMTLGWLRKPEHLLYHEAHKILPYVPPTNLFDLEDGLELEFGNDRLQVYYPGRSHSPDNVVVYFPGRKLLFGGCMILGWDGVGNTADADLPAWAKAVSKLRRFDPDVIVPGHGDRLDPGLLEHTIDLLAKHSE